MRKDQLSSGSGLPITSMPGYCWVIIPLSGWNRCGVSVQFFRLSTGDNLLEEISACFLQSGNHDYHDIEFLGGGGARNGTVSLITRIFLCLKMASQVWVPSQYKRRFILMISGISIFCRWIPMERRRTSIGSYDTAGNRKQAVGKKRPGRPLVTRDGASGSQQGYKVIAYWHSIHLFYHGLS